jgi:prepilin peptidase CpaA
MIQFEFLAVAVAVLACASDLRTRRIPNALTFGAAIAAISIHAAISGVDGILIGVVGWLVGIALFFPFFALGGLGGGDVKLLGAIGACLGPASTIFVGFYAAIAGGVLAVIVALRSRYLGQALRNLRFLATFWLTVGFKPVEELTLDRSQAPRLAYAVPVLVGLVVTIWPR